MSKQKEAYVTVRYEATIGDWAPCLAPPENELSGYVEVPRDMWDRRPPGHRWGPEVAAFVLERIPDDAKARAEREQRGLICFRNIDPADAYCEQHGQYKPCEECDPVGWREHFGLPPDYVLPTKRQSER